MLDILNTQNKHKQTTTPVEKCALGEALLLLLSFALFLWLVSVSLAPLRVHLGTLPLGAPTLRMCSEDLLWFRCRLGSLRVRLVKLPLVLAGGRRFLTELVPGAFRLPVQRVTPSREEGVVG